jgi:hypothetical protein
MSNNNLITILFLASDPTDAGRLRLGQEVRDIREKLQLSQHRERFRLESRESLRSGDITQAIFDVEPQIIHFSGHGKNSGELCFENQYGEAHPVPIEALAKLFELVSGKIQCVLLNACYSEAQAQAISQHVPFVIGMNQAIGDSAAILFSTGFYKALGAMRSAEDAYKFGCLDIHLAGINEFLTPVLHRKNQQDSKSVPQFGSRQEIFSGDDDDDLSSSKGINYRKLRDLLKDYQWHAAEQETVSLMLEVVGRRRDDWLRDMDLKNFPIIDLHTIDNLWIKYSQSRFGFSIQRRIWKSLGSGINWESERILSEQLGWRINGQWIKYESLDFSLGAPPGHLPAVSGWIGGRGWNERCALLSRDDLS